MRQIRYDLISNLDISIYANHKFTEQQMTLKTYLLELDNKKRTVKEVKKEYENQRNVYKNKIDNLFEDTTQDFFVALFKEFTYKEEDALKLYKLFIKLTF